MTYIYFLKMHVIGSIIVRCIIRCVIVRGLVWNVFGSIRWDDKWTIMCMDWSYIMGIKSFGAGVWWLCEIIGVRSRQFVGWPQVWVGLMLDEGVPNQKHYFLSECFSRNHEMSLIDSMSKSE